MASNTTRDSQAGDVVLLAGTVSASEDGVLPSPYEGADCVAHDTRIEIRAHSWGLARLWIVDDRRTDSCRFQITDDAGTITIDPATAALDFPVKSASDAGKSVEITIRALRGAVVDPDTPSSRYTERRLDPGDEVGVLGRVVEGDGPGTDPVVEAVSLFVHPDFDSLVRHTVVRSGGFGVVLACLGLVVMLLTAGVVSLPG